MEAIKVRKNILLGDFLVEQGLINEEQLREALKFHQSQGVRLGQALIDLGFLTESQMIKSLSEQLGVQYVNLSSYRVDPAVLSLVPAEVAWNYHVFPLFRIRDRLTVAMVNPLDVFAIDALTRKTKMKIEPVVCADSEILAALNQNYPRHGQGVQAAPERIAGERTTMVDRKSGHDLHLIEEILEKLARTTARRMWLIGDRLKVDYGLYQAFWPLPKQLDRQSFVRRLASLSEEIHTVDRDPHRGMIRRQYDGQQARFHVLTNAKLDADMFALTVQIPRPENEEIAALPGLRKLSERLAAGQGVSIVAAATSHALDMVYYALWPAISQRATYAISCEAMPTSIFPETVQLSASHPADQLAALRYAIGAGAEVVFLQNITDSGVLAGVAAAAPYMKQLLIGVSHPQPWRAPAALLENGLTAGCRQLVDNIYLHALLSAPCRECEAARRTAGDKPVDPAGQTAPKSCNVCHGTGVAKTMHLEASWQKSSPAGAKTSFADPSVAEALRAQLKHAAEGHIGSAGLSPAAWQGLFAE